jgi:uncharacterized RDD family membrane protein YckC
LDSGSVFAVICVGLRQAFSQQLRFMTCPLCTDICRCLPDAHPAASSRWVSDGALLAAAAPIAETEMPEAAKPASHSSAEASSPSHSPEPEMKPQSEPPPDWRQEVASRLTRYHARRRPRPPRYPSLLLRFEREESVPPASDDPDWHREFSTITASSNQVRSNQALALDTFADFTDFTPEVSPGPIASSATRTVPTAAPATAKIIEFPRHWTPAPAPLDELAEAVFDRNLPRILDVPDVIPLLPALGGITIEPAHQPETEKRPGIDIPLQSAPLAWRILSAAIDGVIIASACALFGFIFWKLTAIRPPRLQILGVAAGLFTLFWSVYQYLLIVHAGSTPGLRLARLQLARFDGRPTSRRLRRWRVFASFLSAASLGMGYAWVFLDEDSLCWHDRITHTYLAPKG